MIELAVTHLVPTLRVVLTDFACVCVWFFKFFKSIGGWVPTLRVVLTDFVCVCVCVWFFKFF